MKKKIETIILIMLLINIFICNVVNAFSISDLTGTKLTDKSIENFGNELITIISTIGSIVSVVVLVILGIKYMLGSVEEKAEYKKTFLPYLIGAILVFSASVVAGIVFRLVQF